MGRNCKVYEILKNIAINKGFEKSILEDDYAIFDSELEKVVCYKQKLLKK